MRIEECRIRKGTNSGWHENVLRLSELFTEEIIKKEKTFPRKQQRKGKDIKAGKNYIYKSGDKVEVHVQRVPGWPSNLLATFQSYVPVHTKKDHYLKVSYSEVDGEVYFLCFPPEKVRKIANV